MASYRYAVSAWIWHGDPSAENYGFIEKAGSMGYDGVEIPTFDGNINEKLINEKLSTSSGKLAPIIVGGGSPELDISSDDQNAREGGLSYIKKLVDKADSINADLVCGPLFSAVGKSLFLSHDQKERVLSRTAGVMERAAAYAKDRGIDIALEPLCRYDSYLINTAREMNHFLDLAGKSNLGVLLDTFHMNIEEDSMESPIAEAGERFRHFQVCENNRGVPGKGQLDWEKIRNAVVNSGYSGWISLESFTPYESTFSSMMRSWRAMEPSQDKFASDGLSFLKKVFK